MGAMSAFGLKKTNLDIANRLTIKYCVVNKGMLHAVESINTINAHKYSLLFHPSELT